MKIILRVGGGQVDLKSNPKIFFGRDPELFVPALPGVEWSGDEAQSENPENNFHPSSPPPRYEWPTRSSHAYNQLFDTKLWFKKNALPLIAVREVSTIHG